MKIIKIITGLVLAFSLISTTFVAADSTIVFSGDDDITAEASSAEGAEIDFSVTATDEVEDLAATCDPASGSMFELGTTSVLCEASNATSTATTTFQVSVVDTAPPTITAPASQTFATTSFPATPTLALATAADSVDPSPTVSVSVTSFEAGTTTVTWTATDASGNTATTSSDVGVFLNIETTVDVPAACDVTDTDGAIHTYEAASSTSYLAICAVQAAFENGSISVVGLSNEFPSFGLFVTSFNGVTADPGSQYWALYLNDDFASFGLTSLPIAAGDSLKLELHDFSDTYQGSRVVLSINSLISTSSATTSDPAPSPSPSSGGGGGDPVTPMFSVSNALAFLAAAQNTDGSFSNELVTDWAALAFAAQDPLAGQAGPAKIKLREYFLSSQPSLSSVTDYERHAMALLALGINPYDATTIDYIKPIVDAFDGTQIGASFPHDDIFALFPLLHAGYSTSDTIIQKATAYIVSKQSSNGSWGDPDSTAAAVQALSLTSSLPGVVDALARAKAYLHSQNGTGGLNNSYSLSWALQAISAFGESPSAWGVDGKTPLESLAALQQADGGVDLASSGVENRVWATAYAVPGALGKTWNSLLSSFPKPAGEPQGQVAGAATTTLLVATSTAHVATSTTSLATSTPEIKSSTSTPETATTTLSLAQEEPQTPEPRLVQNRAATVTTKTSLDAVQENIATPPTERTSTQLAAAASAGDGVLSRIGTFFKRIFGFFGRFF